MSHRIPVCGVPSCSPKQSGDDWPPSEPVGHGSNKKHTMFLAHSLASIQEPQRTRPLTAAKRSAPHCTQADPSEMRAARFSLCDRVGLPGARSARFRAT